MNRRSIGELTWLTHSWRTQGTGTGTRTYRYIYSVTYLNNAPLAFHPIAYGRLCRIFSCDELARTNNGPRGSVGNDTWTHDSYVHPAIATMRWLRTFIMHGAMPEQGVTTLLTHRSWMIKLQTARGERRQRDMWLCNMSAKVHKLFQKGSQCCSLYLSGTVRIRNIPQLVLKTNKTN